MPHRHVLIEMADGTRLRGPPVPPGRAPCRRDPRRRHGSRARPQRRVRSRPGRDRGGGAKRALGRTRGRRTRGPRRPRAPARRRARAPRRPRTTRRLTSSSRQGPIGLRALRVLVSVDRAVTTTLEDHPRGRVDTARSIPAVHDRRCGSHSASPAPGTQRHGSPRTDARGSRTAVRWHFTWIVYPCAGRVRAASDRRGLIRWRDGHLPAHHGSDHRP